MSAQADKTEGRVPDIIIAGVPVHGAPGSPPGSDALAITGRDIAAVGRASDILAMAGEATRIIRPAGGCVIPGLIDGHAHLDREGLKSIWPSLDGARTKDDVVARIGELARAARPGEWIVTMPLGNGPAYDGIPAFLEEGLPTRQDLDAVAPDNPVYIRPIWGYWRPQPPLVSIANSRALEMAGIDRDTLPPAPTVTIVRDEATGEPNGIFLEQTTMPIVELTLMACAPHFTQAQRVAALARSMEIYNSFGTTGVYEGHGVAQSLADAWQELAAQGRQSVRARLTISPSWKGRSVDDAKELVRDWARSLKARGRGDRLLVLEGLYAEIDEKKENWVRAGARPQTGWAGFYYDCGLPRADLKEVLVEAARNGMQVSSILADVPPLFEEVNRAVPIGGLRWAAGHISILGQAEIARARDLGLVLVTHTNRHIGKMGSIHRARLGPEGENDIVPLRRLLDAGVPVSLGTDNVPPPLWKPVWHAVARRDGFTREVIAPDQKLTRAEALHCATWNGAYLCGNEDVTGSIEPGKRADVCLLDADYMTIAEDDIAGLQARTVIVDGRIVYERAAA